MSSSDLAATASRRCAVFGSPIGHSLSPVLHRTAYGSLGLTGWRYDAYEVDEAALPNGFAGLGPDWRGLSLTMPLKRAVIPLCDTVTPLAREVSAVNTVVFTPEGVVGSNTDVGGVAAALRERGVDAIASALILGIGATAGSVLAGLAELGVRRVTTYGRDPSKAGPLSEIAHGRGVELEVLDWRRAHRPPGVDVVVSTVPADVAEPLAGTLAGATDAVFDVVYDPWPTPLASAAANRDRMTVSGFDLLLHQAALQVETMTERSPAPLAAMRAAGEAALAARRSAP